MSPSHPNDMNCLSWGSLTLAVSLRHVVQWQEGANLMVTSKPQIYVIKPHGFIFRSCMCPFRGRGDGDPGLSDAFPGKWGGPSAHLPSKREGAGRGRASATALQGTLHECMGHKPPQMGRVCEPTWRNHLCVHQAWMTSTPGTWVHYICYHTTDNSNWHQLTQVD